MRRLLLTMALAALTTHAWADSYYLTDAPGSADVWVIVTDNPGVADCTIYRGDIISTPTVGGGVIWLYPTDAPGAADKWIMITGLPNLADPASCLRD